MASDVTYAAVLSCGVVEQLPATGMGAAALGLLLRHGGDAVEVERVTTTWVGTLSHDGYERWGRVTSPATDADSTTYWQVLRWNRTGDAPQYWTYPTYSEAVSNARVAVANGCAREVMVTRIVCDPLGVILRNGHVYGPALRRLAEVDMRGVTRSEAADAAAASEHGHDRGDGTRPGGIEREIA